MINNIVSGNSGYGIHEETASADPSSVTYNDPSAAGFEPGAEDQMECGVG